MNISLVVMAGGSGTRLWPLSRSMYPKQFLPLTSDKSMFQETFLRCKDLPITKRMTLCNEDHRFIVAEQLKNLNIKSEIVLEPFSKNTAPAIALAAFLEKDKDSLLLILPSDHVIKKSREFSRLVLDSIDLARSGKIVTFGIVPNNPSTGYGYIEKGGAIDSGYEIKRFIEKPPLSDAENYANSDMFLWNSGMFLVKASKYLDELKTHHSGIYDVCKRSTTKINKEHDFTRIDKKTFNKCPSESIDYAVMEKTNDAAVVPCDIGWNDLGSWSSVHESEQSDEDGNVASGKALFNNSSDTYINSDSQLVVALGLKNTSIVTTKDVVLVANNNHTQEIKDVVEHIKAIDEYGDITKFHNKVHRPWGTFESLDIGELHQVKRIMVKPNEKLSVQRHKHRAEHWVVVKGTAEVSRDDEVITLKENESIYLPLGCIHALKNPGNSELELIEVQFGTYLGEDDIERLEDIYGRNSDD